MAYADYEDPKFQFDDHGQANFGVLFRMYKRELYCFSRYTKQVTTYYIEALPSYVQGSERIVWLSHSRIFITGGQVKETYLSD